MKKLLLLHFSLFTIFYSHSQNIYCSADFSYTQNGTIVTFSDQSVVVPANPWGNYHSLSWAWDFGDGSTSNLQDPTHTYSSNAVYIACLTLTFFDSTVMNYCTSVYCDSIIVGNIPSATWDCAPSGCYDPGTGLGQYTSLSACQAVCGAPTPSWDCPVNMPGGCYDPGTGLGQYSSLAACQAVCGTPAPSWDCGPQGCYDPGNGMGQYTILAACQAVCVSTISNLCDSMTLFSTGGSLQTILTAEVPNINTIIDYWITTAPDGTVLGEDSMWNTHQIYNMDPSNGMPFDTITTCITYSNNTCCLTWIWDANLGVWAKAGNLTLIENIKPFDKRLLRIVDALGRETEFKANTLLFYIYNDGRIEKKYIYR